LTGLGRTERLLLGATVVAIVLAAVARYASGVSEEVAFVLATVALAGAAWAVSFAVEQVGARLGPAQTGVLQATVANLPEFFVVVFALNAGQRVVAQSAIVGSILVNALLVLGLVIIAGSLRARDGVMRFNPRLPNDTATLLLVSTFIIVLIGLATLAHSPASHHVETISIIGAVAILIVYAVWMQQYLRGGQRTAGRGDGDAPAAPGALPLRTAIGLLVGAGVAAAFVSDWFVHALEPTVHSLGLSQAFAGLVIVAIAGNAVENVAGIVLARKGKAELAISIVKNSVAQIAAFLYPVLVLVSLLTTTRLTFATPAIYTGALFGTAVIVWQVTGDGEATPFEGAALVAAYVILAAVAAFE
jgi:Ca2+:H+ antiporter